MLKVINARKNYGDFQLDCSLELKPGKVIGIVGRNGAGKSTLFKAILGLIHLDGGEIQVLPEGIYKSEAEKKQDIGICFAEGGFSQVLTPAKVCKIMKDSYTAFNQQFFLMKCEEYALPLNKKIKEFSTGMKAKLKVICAMSHNAKLLILDEPTAGLDVVVRDELLEMLEEYMESGDRGVIISSHISSDLESICDEIYLINDGSFILHETMDNIFKKYGILVLADEEFENIDKTYIVRIKKEKGAYRCLTNEAGYYGEKYPEMTIEKGNIDDLVKLMIRGEE